MFKNLFGKKPASKTITVYSPANGVPVGLEEVPDPVFSEKMMGDGLAVKPSDGIIVAPVDGEVIQVFPTKHAIGLKAENGAEILIHIGLETVALQGEGFEAHVQQGDKVKRGDRLVTFDVALVSERAKSTITPMIITNPDDMESQNALHAESAVAGETPVMEITAK